MPLNGGPALDAEVIQIFDDRQEQQYQRHQQQYVIMRYIEPARGALPADLQRREEQHIK